MATQQETQNNKKLSFIVPVYNKAPWLERCIQSLIDQDYESKEIIFVDDGSTDGSQDILRKYEDKIKVIFASHKGACHARNLGAKEATGDYFSFFPADSFLYPGAVSKWMKLFEEHPEVDFVYGGYRFFEEGVMDVPFMAEEFDPYFLKQYNYIDGSFPVSRKAFEAVNGWDESIKSLQDWDFWLCIVEKGFKGFYQPELFFDTAPIQKGGLSEDSANNWLKRVDTIQKKHGYKPSPICVSSLGAPFHGKMIAKLLNCEFRQFPNRKPNRFKAIYLLGFYCSRNSIAAHGEVFFGFKGTRIIHWIGTDILQLAQNTYAAGLDIVNALNKEIDVHLTEFKDTQDELAHLGIKSTIVPLPTSLALDKTELPKDFTVAVYAPKNNRDLYYYALMLDLAKAMPDVQFKFFGCPDEKGMSPTLPNVEFMGFIEDMNTFIQTTSCLLRMTWHDGFPITIGEWKIAGRHVIWNHRSPFIEYTEPKLDDLIEKIRLLKKSDMEPVGDDYYKKLLDTKKYIKKIYGLI